MRTSPASLKSALINSSLSALTSDHELTIIRMNPTRLSPVQARRMVGLVLAAVLTPLSSGAQKPPDDDQIRGMLRDAVETRHVAPGIALAVVDAHGTRFFCDGKTDAPQGQNIDPGTLFEIGSVSKTFTALLL